MKQLPQSQDSERAVLGAVLINPNALSRVATIIGVDDFANAAHAAIFGAMSALADASSPIDLLTVKLELERRGSLATIAGGSAYVSSLVDGIPDVANVERYARFVREKAALRRLVTIGQTLSNAAQDAEADAGELASDNALRLSEFAITENAGPQPIRAVGRRALADLDSRMAAGQWITGVPTGLPSIDGYTLGVQRGVLSVLGARTRTGKTAFAISIALHALRESQRVLLVELDMSEAMIGTRLVATIAGVDAYKLRTGQSLDQAELDRVAKAGLEMNRLHDRFLVDTSTRNVGKLAAIIRREARHGGLDLVIVDHIGHVEGGKGERRYLELGDVSRRLIAIAGEAKVAMLALAQLKREGEDRPPVLSDLRESGNLEQDARLVLMLDRPSLRDREIPGCQLDVVIPKNEGDAGHLFTVHFDLETQFIAEEPQRLCRSCQRRPEPMWAPEPGWKEGEGMFR